MAHALFRHSVLSILRAPVTPCASPSVVCPRLAARVSSPRWYAAAAASTTDRPRNKNIPYDIVCVVDSETGKLGPPQKLEDVLASLTPRDNSKKREEKKFFLELAAPPSPNTGGYALVKIRDSKAAYEKMREMRQRHRQVQKQNETKEVQLTWGVAEADLDHKLRKVRMEISKGFRVDVVIALKKNQSVMTPAEREATVASVLSNLEDVAREWQPRDVTRSMTVLHLQDKNRPLPPNTKLSTLQASATSTSTRQ